MNEAMKKIQLWGTIGTSIIGAVLLLTSYFDWFVPSPTFSIILGIIAFGLYANHVLQRDGDRKKEVFLLFIISIYINLFISGSIYNLWTSEAIFTKQGITQMSIFVFLILSIAMIISYVRAKMNYKKVRGNQRHSEAWQITKKELKEMKASDDIYINLGLYQQKERE